MVPPTYDRLAELPVPTSAYFVDQHVIQLNSSIQDFTRNTRRSVSKSIAITPDSTFASPNQEISEVILSRPSRSGEYQAILREIGSGDQKRRFVEVWSKERILTSKEVTEVHGAFYNDEEKNTHPKDSPAYFRYSQSFGEGFPGKKRPTIFIFAWDPKSSNPEKSAVLRVSTNASQIFFGQALFSSNSDVIFATGYEHTLGGRLLGLKGCYNRPSGIWKVELEGNILNSILDTDTDNRPSSIDAKLLKLTPPHLSCRSPRILINENSERLFWLACSTGGAHASTSGLYSLNLTTDVKPDNCQVVVDTVEDIRGDGFPGFYPDAALPPSPFLRIGHRDYLITHSTVTSYNAVTLISLEDGTVTNLTPSREGSSYSWGVLCTDGKRQVLCVRTSPTVPYEVVLGELDDSAKVSWRVLQSSLSHLSEELQKKLQELKVSTVRIPDRRPVETVVIQHTDIKGGKPLPHILMPHGGPHATSIVRFDPTVVAFALEGFNISLPNYTGSLGFGESHVKNLLGKCGTLDVEDCIESLRYLKKNGVVKEGSSKVFLFGGSHGGFLTGHLLGQYPDVFTAACLRNPVISSGEVSTSDIREWYWLEFKHDYPIRSSAAGSDGLSPNSNMVEANDIGLMRPELYESLFKLSPIAHVEQVKAAVLLCVGGSDKRVAPTQGIDYYHALKAARAKANLPDNDVEMLWFPEDGHPLEGIEASRMTWVRTLEWFTSRL
ncbi:alpha/beta-hydrolase [Marasmius fiardii PR-910]|nr:alpha/beta-hydrolase [Marasmius fiardii PR-910]